MNAPDRGYETPKCCVNEGEIVTSGKSDGLGSSEVSSNPNHSVTLVESKDLGSLVFSFTLKGYLREISMKDDSG